VEAFSTQFHRKWMSLMESMIKKVHQIVRMNGNPTSTIPDISVKKKNILPLGLL
jgi:hypothetical protein